MAMHLALDPALLEQVLRLCGESMKKAAVTRSSEMGIAGESRIDQTRQMTETINSSNRHIAVRRIGLIAQPRYASQELCC